MSESYQAFAAALADRYLFKSELGRGGMATVYLAEDVRHRRMVAIKVLRDDIAATVGATRFLREIQIEARLQHPNILPLLDSGTADGQLYYVMPFVAGTTLRDRIAAEGALPIGESVRILAEIADALSYAHRHGVVHRDIKPENVMLSDRHAMVADVGVARALSEATGGVALTSSGVALGTPSYMAPEQALADPNADERADLYALGVVAYEMLAGQLPFSGVTPQQMLAAHVSVAPRPIATLRPELAPALEQVIMRCLEKRAADRWQTADALLAALEPYAGPNGGFAPTTARLARATRTRWMLAAVLVVAMGAGALALRARAGPARLTLGRSVQLSSDDGLEIQPDISPDGKLVAYAAGNSRRTRIFIRSVGGTRTIPLSEDSATMEESPKWSPDGTRILFIRSGDVRVTQALGGVSRALVPGGPNGMRGAGWSPDGTHIWAARDDSLFIFAAGGGSSRLVTTYQGLHSCAWRPDGAWLACVAGNFSSIRVGRGFGNVASSQIILVPAGGGPPTPITPADEASLSPAWTPDGSQLLFIWNHDGPHDIYALAVDGAGQPQAAPRRVTTGLGPISFSVSADGARVAYSTYLARANIYALPMPAHGVATIAQATAVTSANQVIETLNLSRDGRWLLFDSNLGGRAHAWRVPVGGGRAEQLTDGPRDEFAPDLSPDGRWLAYYALRDGTRNIEVTAVGGGTEPERVTRPPASAVYPMWSPDGNALVFFKVGSDATLSAWTIQREAAGRWSVPRKVAEPARQPAWSPDGGWIAYAAAGVFVVPSSGGVPRKLVGMSDEIQYVGRVLWSRAGDRIFFKAFDADTRASVWVVDVVGGAPRRVAMIDDASRVSNRDDFTVDDGHLYFCLAERQADVFVADLTRKR